MGRHIKAEFLKLSKSFGFKVLLLCAVSGAVFAGILVALFYEGGFGETTGLDYFLNSISGENQITNVFAGVFLGIFIGSEFSRGTFGISIARGSSRIQVILAKAVVFLAALPLVVLVLPITLSIPTTLANGFGDFNTLRLLRTIGLFVLTHWAMGGICVLLAVLIKNVAGIIGFSVVLLTFLFPILPEVHGLESVSRFMYSYHIVRVVEPQSIALLITVCVATLGITLTSAVIVFKRTELK